MEQNATVLKVENGKALVKFIRATACGDNCKGCGMCDANAQRWVLNSVKAKEGDRVTVFVENKIFLTMCLVAYILPVLIMIAGFYFIGVFVPDKKVSDMLSLLLLVLTVLFISLLKFRSDKFKSRIIKIG